MIQQDNTMHPRQRTAGHPPPGFTYERSAPGAHAARMNSLGAVPDNYGEDNESDVRPAA